MKNPWTEISLNNYEKHMGLDSVYQLQALNGIMKEQFYSYPVKSVMVLGVAGGNGLEHIDTRIFENIYGVDINNDYLYQCSQRFPGLKGILKIICTDLMGNVSQLPYSDLIIADLLIEYIGYEHFQKVVAQVKSKYISCVIQKNTDTSFVSDSPYLHEFDDLEQIHHQMDETSLKNTMKEVGYNSIYQIEKELPNGKKLMRIDFKLP